MKKLNDTIYKYLTFNGFAEYIITAVIHREGAILYEVECQACQHGLEKCRLLVADKKDGTFNFCSMVSENDDDPQHYWHDDDIFYADLRTAKIAKYDEVAKKKHDAIEEHKGIVSRLEKEYQEILQHKANL